MKDLNKIKFWLFDLDNTLFKYRLPQETYSDCKPISEMIALFGSTARVSATTCSGRRGEVLSSKLGFINSLHISRQFKLIFGFSFCGSLTTFSGWSLQLFQLISEGLYKLFFLLSILIVLISFFAVGLGNFVAKTIEN